MGNGEHGSVGLRLDANRNDFILTCVVHVLQVGFVAADMNHPARDLPRVLNTAMAVAISGFMLMNIALFMVLPFEQMRQKSFVAVVCSLDCSRNPLNHVRPLLKHRPEFRPSTLWPSGWFDLFIGRVSRLLGSAECQPICARKTQRHCE